VTSLVRANGGRRPVVLAVDDDPQALRELGRDPFLLETSVPGVFVAATPGTGRSSA
jgi:hypothetical protein